MDFYRAAVILIVLPIIGGLVDGRDIQSEMTTCLQSMLQDQDADVEEFVSNPLPNWEIRKFLKVCSNKVTFDKCMEIIPKDDSVKALVEISEILSKKIDFLCGDGKSKYIKHQTCLSKEIVEAGVGTCSMNFGNEYKAANKKTAAECAAIIKFRKCVAQAGTICGGEARDLVSTYMDFNVEPYLGTPDCPKKASGNGVSTTHVTILNLMVPAVVLLLKTL